MITRMVNEVGGTAEARVMDAPCQWICHWIGAESIGRRQHRASPTDNSG